MHILSLLLLSIALGLAACAPGPGLPDSAPAVSEGLPDDWYRAAAAAGERVRRVDPARSLIVLEVGRAGPLAGLGHDHVIASRDVRGYVAPGRGRADLLIPLEKLTVDEPALRTEAGYAGAVPADAIEGTRRNMLDKVLHTARFPVAAVAIERLPDARTLRVSLTLRGIRREMQVPVRIEEGADGLIASGKLDLLQSDFGITPFSVLGGALQVRDRIALRFRIHAS